MNVLSPCWMKDPGSLALASPQPMSTAGTEIYDTITQRDANYRRRNKEIRGAVCNHLYEVYVLFVLLPAARSNASDP